MRREGFVLSNDITALDQMNLPRRYLTRADWLSSVNHFMVGIDDWHYIDLYTRVAGSVKNRQSSR